MCGSHVGTQPNYSAARQSLESCPALNHTGNAFGFRRSKFRRISEAVKIPAATFCQLSFRSDSAKVINESSHVANA